MLFACTFMLRVVLDSGHCYTKNDWEIQTRAVVVKTTGGMIIDSMGRFLED